MSWQAFQAVRDFSKATGVTKAVFMVIGSYCDSAGTMDGLKHPPSYKTIASGAGCSESGAKGAVAKLIKMGELSSIRKGSGRGSKVFFSISSFLIEQERGKRGKSLQEITVLTQYPIENNGTHTVPNGENEYSHSTQSPNNGTHTVPNGENEYSHSTQSPNNGTHTVPISNLKSKEEEIREEEEPPTPLKPKKQKVTEQSLDVDFVFNAWREFFKDKPQPRRTPSQRKKVLTRLKNPDFVKSYRDALYKASTCLTLHHESWFNFDYFVRNDDNYIKMLDGWMDWKDERAKVPASSTTPAQNHLTAGYLRPA